MFNGFLELCSSSGIRSNEDRVVTAVVLFRTIPLSSPEVTDYSIRRQLVARLKCTHFARHPRQFPEPWPKCRSQRDKAPTQPALTSTSSQTGVPGCSGSLSTDTGDYTLSKIHTSHLKSTLNQRFSENGAVINRGGPQATANSKSRLAAGIRQSRAAGPWTCFKAFVAFSRHRLGPSVPYTCGRNSACFLCLPSR